VLKLKKIPAPKGYLSSVKAQGDIWGYFSGENIGIIRPEMRCL